MRTVKGVHASRGSLFLPNGIGLRNEAASVLAALLYLPTMMKATNGRTAGRPTTEIPVTCGDWDEAVAFLATRGGSLELQAGSAERRRRGRAARAGQPRPCRLPGHERQDRLRRRVPVLLAFPVFEYQHP